MLDEENAGIEVETAQPSDNGEVVEENKPQEESAPDPTENAEDRVFTQDEVTRILKKRLERLNSSYYNRFGVDSDEKLDEYIKNHSSMAEELQNLKNTNLELTRINSFLRNNINPDKYDDIITYFKGKEMDFSEDELINLIKTHPDWVVATQAVAPQQKTTITSISPERGHDVGETPDEKMKRIFGY